MKLLGVFLAFLFIIPPLEARLLFFSSFEEDSLIKTLSKRTLNKNKISKTDGILFHFSGSLLLSKDNWTVWLNKKRIHADNPHYQEGDKIYTVTPLNEQTIELKDQKGNSQTVCLSQQTPTLP